MRKKAAFDEFCKPKGEGSGRVPARRLKPARGLIFDGKTGRKRKAFWPCLTYMHK